MPSPKLKNLFVSETCLRFCAIDLRISFLALVIVAKKSKTVSETCKKSSRFGTVSETQGLALQICGFFLYFAMPHCVFGAYCD